MRRNCPPTAGIEILAERQFGYVAREQLLALGFTEGWIRSQLRRGWLIRVHAGIYAVGHVPRFAMAHAFAAVFACGDGAALSHAAGAAHWGAGEWPLVMEVSATGHRRRPDIRSHRVAVVEARTHLGIRVTTPARTVRDLAPRLTDAGLVRLVNDLRLAGHLGATAFTELTNASARLDRLLGSSADSRPTRSALEDLLPPFTRRHRLPMPQLNAILPENGREVDALYREARLIIELDSWRHHSDGAAFERDRAKDAAALALGYLTLRITHRRLMSGGDAEAATIRRILGSPGGQYSPSPRA